MTLKEKIITLLENRRFEEIAEMVAKRKSTLRYLQRLLYDQEGLLRWRAIECMGLVADRLAEENPDAVRDIIRRQIWSINDESGGIGWSAPEVVGEIVYHRPEMFKEFAPIVIFSNLDELMLLRGVTWAAGRIAQARADLVMDAVPVFMELLNTPDPVVCGYIIRFLDIVGKKINCNMLKHLLEDESIVSIYENGELRKTTVKNLAENLAIKNV